ncbi:hypothetical protein [Thalassotalea agarivorans]|uniref:MetA-pathway of phenol degradation n=1 Tax=Thalassotalea agarivorans TaxID=349064 RepID=A0A1I0B4K2_THASX|nr:hypothetical protein [Thalassotalea agarivorans]SET00918.1 hypothetical protein SAMN05660429_00903 [Thalassotalea agarivorans]
MFKGLVAILMTIVCLSAQATEQKSSEQLSAEDEAVLCNCDQGQELPKTEQFATVKQKKIGEPLLDEDGNPVKWDRPLPFFAQNVLDLGFDLPKPFGIAIVPNTVSQDLLLTDLFVGINGSEKIPIDFVQFGTARAENANLQLKADVWVFPFLNLYATYGVMEGSADAPIQIKGNDLLEFLGINCDGLFAPNACVRTFAGIAKPEYTGSNYSIGFNLAMGWDRFFVTLPVTYVVTDLNILQDDVTAINVSPRIGISTDAAHWGTLSTFVGITYLHAELDVAGSLALDTSDIPGLDDVTNLDFVINQENKDKINFLIGFNWDVTKHWSFHAEAGIGGSRENFIASTTYRF